MKDIYRGDTFEFDFTAEYENGKPYVFSKGDKLKAGMKTDDNVGTKYLLYKVEEVQQITDSVHFEFTPKETKKLPKGTKIFEVELTNVDGKVDTIFQDNVMIKGDIIND